MKYDITVLKKNIKDLFFKVFLYIFLKVMACSFLEHTWACRRRNVSTCHVVILLYVMRADCTTTGFITIGQRRQNGTCNACRCFFVRMNKCTFPLDRPISSSQLQNKTNKKVSNLNDLGRVPINIDDKFVLRCREVMLYCRCRTIHLLVLQSYPCSRVSFVRRWFE